MPGYLTTLGDNSVIEDFYHTRHAHLSSFVSSPCTMCSVYERVFSTLGHILSKWGDIMIHVGRYLECIGGCPARWGRGIS